MENFDIGDQISITIDEEEEILGSESENEQSSFLGTEKKFDCFRRNGMMKVDEESTEHGIISSSFLSGMGSMRKNTEVVRIHKIDLKSRCNDLSTKKARLESFRIFQEAVAEKNGGYGNVRYGWYGGSREEIGKIVERGFSRCRSSGHANCEEDYGVGIYLSPAKFSIDGAMSSAVDENGLRHVLLCRVILGKMEKIFPGSKQSHPSSKEFDSGVDNLLEPRRYIIWSSFMNSHIFPYYIITFKAPHLNGVEKIPAKVVRPSSPWMSFPTLISILSKFLQPSKIASIVKSHNDFLKNKMTRPQLIHNVRHIAGDKLLMAVIKHCRYKV